MRAKMGREDIKHQLLVNSRRQNIGRCREQSRLVDATAAFIVADIVADA